MTILNRDRKLLATSRVLGNSRTVGTGILDNLRSLGKVLSPLINILNQRGSKWVNELQHEIGYDLGKTAANVSQGVANRVHEVGRKIGETAGELVNKIRSSTKGAALVPYGMGVEGTQGHPKRNRLKSDSTTLRTSTGKQLDSEVLQLIRGTGLKIL